MFGDSHQERNISIFFRAHHEHIDNKNDDYVFLSRPSYFRMQHGKLSVIILIFIEDYLMRPSNREANQLRSVKLTRNYTKHAEGSVLVEFGQTKVLCNASVIDGVPRFIKGKIKVG